MGSCHVEGESVEDESADLWRDCAIFDVSALGLGIDLRHPGPSELLGRRMTVLLEIGPSVDLSVTGEVRNAESGPDGIARSGIEFVGLTEAERSIVDLLERRAVTRARA
jgi:hypothetical protein